MIYNIKMLNNAALFFFLRVLTKEKKYVILLWLSKKSLKKACTKAEGTSAIKGSLFKFLK